MSPFSEVLIKKEARKHSKCCFENQNHQKANCTLIKLISPLSLSTFMLSIFFFIHEYGAKKNQQNGKTTHPFLAKTFIGDL